MKNVDRKVERVSNIGRSQISFGKLTNDPRVSFKIEGADGKIEKNVGHRIYNERTINRKRRCCNQLKQKYRKKFRN